MACISKILHIFSIFNGGIAIIKCALYMNLGNNAIFCITLFSLDSFSKFDSVSSF